MHSLILVTVVAAIALAGIVANARLLQLLRQLSGSPASARRTLFAWLAEKTALARHPSFNGLHVIIERSGRVLWRSDFHALRFLLPWFAGFFGLLSALCVWLARPQRCREARS